MDAFKTCRPWITSAWPFVRLQEDAPLTKVRLRVVKLLGHLGGKFNRNLVTGMSLYKDRICRICQHFREMRCILLLVCSCLLWRKDEEVCRLGLWEKTQLCGSFHRYEAGHLPWSISASHQRAGSVNQRSTDQSMSVRCHLYSCPRPRGSGTCPMFLSLQVAACELLHSLVVYMVGKSAQMVEGENKLPPMYKLHKRLFPVLLRLACDVDQVRPSNWPNSHRALNVSD